VHRVKAAWLALSLGAVSALGEGQEPESACRYARGGGGLGALTAMREAVIVVAVFFLLGAMATALIVHFVVP